MSQITDHSVILMDAFDKVVGGGANVPPMCEVARHQSRYHTSTIRVYKIAESGNSTGWKLAASYTHGIKDTKLKDRMARIAGMGGM